MEREHCAAWPQELKEAEQRRYRAVCRVKMLLENDHPTALLGCRGNYDIAVQIDEVTGTMTGWHWFK